jgi:CRISPR-associated endonuclease/helicase Cas3
MHMMSHAQLIPTGDSELCVPCLRTVPNITSPQDSAVLDFWGKAQKDADSGGVQSHPIAFHNLDVAACLRAILLARPLTLRKCAALLGLKPIEALHVLIALASLHDLGKFGKSFQAKRPDLWPASLGQFREPPKSFHTSDGYLLWNDGLSRTVIERVWPNGSNWLQLLAPAIFGHHGRPVARSTATASRVLGDAGVHAAEICAKALLDLLHPEPVSSRSVTNPETASWWVAGLMTLSDWIGSHEEWFAYKSVNANLDLKGNLREYWKHAKRMAHIAIREAGLIPASVASIQSFEALTGTPSLSPAQRWASEVDLPDGPVLIILEDVTGSGKTEAAQILVHRLMLRGNASGVYWAMPTQATANAMYDRQGDAIRRLFADGDGPRPSLALAHGQARLNEKFRATVLGGISEVSARIRVNPSNADVPSEVVCAAFLADDRRASLLADIGSGTIDQAILGVLPSRFNTLRLFGLAEKILVMDEAHAYDAYVSIELQTILKFHAALGGSAVVLSATLSIDQRRKIVEAWSEELPGGKVPRALFAPSPPPLELSTAYPLATVVGGETRIVVESPIRPAAWSTRTVGVRFVHDEAALIDELRQAHEAGAAVVWVRNTVRDCMSTARLLRSLGLDPLVFHARFAQADRQAREREVLHIFGKEATNEERRGRILIATQVIEQSLDLDFDVMFTDVAPIDLLIQRLGRFRRHEELRNQRPSGIASELVILAPPMIEDPPKDWLKELLPGTNAVYADTGVIWRTVCALAKSKRIATPGTVGDEGGVRHLVESVYGKDDTPVHLEKATLDARARVHADAATALYGTLKVENGYNGSAIEWVNEIRVPTRLGRNPTIIRLARVMSDGKLEPWVAPDEFQSFPMWKRWALSEVGISVHTIPTGSAADHKYDHTIAEVRRSWGKYELDIPVAPLVCGADGIWAGVLFAADGGKAIHFQYSPADGFVVGE